MKTRDDLLEQIHDERAAWHALLDEIGEDRMEDAPLVEADFFGHLHEEHEPSIRAWLQTR